MPDPISQLDEVRTAARKARAEMRQLEEAFKAAQDAAVRANLEAAMRKAAAAFSAAVDAAGKLVAQQKALAAATPAAAGAGTITPPTPAQLQEALAKLGLPHAPPAPRAAPDETGAFGMSGADILAARAKRDRKILAAQTGPRQPGVAEADYVPPVKTAPAAPAPPAPLAGPPVGSLAWRKANPFARPPTRADNPPAPFAEAPTRADNRESKPSPPLIGGADALGALSAFTGGLTSALKSVANFPQTLAGIFAPVTQLVEAFDPGLVTLFMQAIRDLTASLGSALTPVIEAATKVADVFNALFTTIGPEFMPVVKMVADELVKLAVVAVNLLRPALSGLADFAKLVVEALVPLVNDLVPIFQELMGINKDLGDALTEVWKVVLPPLVQGLRILARTIGDAIVWIRDRLRDLGIGSGSARNNPQAPLNLNNRTTAASPAHIIGSEQIGEQARVAAFGARTLQEQQLEAAREAAATLEEIARNTRNQNQGSAAQNQNPAQQAGVGINLRTAARTTPFAPALDLLDLARAALNTGGA